MALYPEGLVLAQSFGTEPDTIRGSCFGPSGPLGAALPAAACKALQPFPHIGPGPYSEFLPAASRLFKKLDQTETIYLREIYVVLADPSR
jgi:hypothetical protein